MRPRQQQQQTKPWRVRVRPGEHGEWWVEIRRPDGHIWGEPVPYGEMRKALAAAKGISNRRMTLQTIEA
ncbi:MAG TPA: hypothetical protein P5199_13375 [Thermoanaerobaculia bacterium]|jgi:hypothetical protein|nr:hypothetical protein [Thermoanaerobaculia bacterium]